MSLPDSLQRALGEAYAVERELGGGGMSRVFLATDTALGRQVVIKVLAPELAEGVNRERFGREILLAAQLQHPHIVPVLAAGTAGELPYYIMPFVAGESLRALLSQRGALPAREAVPILRDVARALAFAHSRGVVHRDIKPENVLLSGGVAMVTDFGVAKALAEGRAQPAAGGLASVGTSLGTLAYMAPEQAAADPDVDHRADLYSFGVMAFELLHGQAPFAGLGARELLTAIVATEPPGLETLVPDVPLPLAGVVRRCLAKAPEDRPVSAAEVVAALEGALTPSGAAAATLTLPGPRISRRAVALLTAVALIGGALTTGWVLRHRSAPPAVAPNSVAVLPLVRVGGTVEDDYFVDGITDELTTALSRVPSLKVASSASAFAFRGRGDIDVREVGRELGVATVLAGTVRKDRDRMRVTVQLSGSADGIVRWAESYEREVTGMLAIKDEISRGVILALSPALDTSASASAPATRDVEAWDLYLRGRFFWRQRGTAALRSAAAYFERAIARDSNFARAWAGLADAAALLPAYGPTPVDSVLPIAEHAASRAVLLDSTLPEAHAALGQLYRSVGRWAESERALDHAIRADSAYAPAHQWQGELFAVLGRFDAAARAMERARALDPMSPIITGELGYVRALAGRWDSAVVAGRRAIQLAPELWTGYAFLGSAYLWHGDATEAVSLLGRAMSLAPENPFGGVLAYAYAKAGNRARAEELAATLESSAAAGRASPTTVAIALTGLGRTDEAMHWLEKAIDARDGFLYASSLRVPWFDALRTDPRFQELSRRMAGPH